MLQQKMNLFGIAGGVTIILLVIVSVFVPWWRLTIGEPVILQANTSPLNTNFGFLGNSFTIPLIWAFNIASIILLTAGAITILIYSINPTKPYAAKLLSFSYKKPLYALVFFLIGLITTILLIKYMLGLSIPLMGSANETLSGGVIQGLTQGVQISVLMSASFVWPFWLSILAVGLCIAARFYHKKVALRAEPSVPSSPHV